MHFYYHYLRVSSSHHIRLSLLFYCVFPKKQDIYLHYHSIILKLGIKMNTVLLPN